MCGKFQHSSILIQCIVLHRRMSSPFVPTKYMYVIQLLFSKYTCMFLRISLFYWSLHCLSFGLRFLRLRLLLHSDSIHCYKRQFLITALVLLLQEEFEDTKGAIRIRTSKKNRQHNGQKKKYKRTNNDLQNIHIKLKIE